MGILYYILFGWLSNSKPPDTKEDLSALAVQGYILKELEECSRTVQYFTDGTSTEDRSDITSALGQLILHKEVVRKGNTFHLPR